MKLHRASCTVSTSEEIRLRIVAKNATSIWNALGGCYSTASKHENLLLINGTNDYN
uniref:Uncharacterized protein n=1 Tax=Parascaris equorum TaxID=6256 RepID=A0A914S1P9_PAREQ